MEDLYNKLWLIWQVELLRSCSLKPQMSEKWLLTVINFGKIWRSINSKDSYLDAKNQLKMKKETTRKKRLEVPIFYLIMLLELMIFEKFQFQVNNLFDWSRLEIHGVIQDGMVNSVKKTKLGMNTKNLKQFLATISQPRQKLVGGCVGMISTRTLINFTLQRFSLQHGNSILSLMNGLETPQEVLIHGPQKRTKTKSLIQTTNGLTILNTDFQSQRRLKFTSVWCKKMLRSQIDLTHKSTSS